MRSELQARLENAWRTLRILGDGERLTGEELALYRAGTARLVPFRLYGELDPILIASGFEVTSPSTQAFSLGLPAPSRLVFNPAGTRGENVYTSFAQVADCAATMGGPVEIFVPADATIPAGSYTMPAVWFLTLADGITLTLDVGSTFSTFPAFTQGLGVGTAVLTGNSATTPHFTVAGNARPIFQNLIVTMGAAAFLLSASGSCELTLTYAVQLIVGESSVSLFDSAGQGICLAFNGSIINSNAFTSGTSAELSCDASCSVSTSQVGGATLNLVDNAFGMSYPPIDPTPWMFAGGSVPTDAGQALDTLSTLIPAVGTLTVSLRIGGTPSPGVYTTWADLLTALASTPYAAVTVYLDFSIGAANPAAGVYPMPPYVTLVDTQGINSIDYSDVQFSGTKSLSVVDCLMTTAATTRPLIESTTGQNVIFRAQGSTTVTSTGGTNPLVDVVGSDYLISLQGSARLATTGQAVVALDAASVGQLQIDSGAFYETAAISFGSLTDCHYTIGQALTSVVFAPNTTDANLSAGVFNNFPQLMQALRLTKGLVTVYVDFAGGGNTFTVTPATFTQMPYALAFVGVTSVVNANPTDVGTLTLTDCQLQGTHFLKIENLNVVAGGTTQALIAASIDSTLEVAGAGGLRGASATHKAIEVTAGAQLTVVGEGNAGLNTANCISVDATSLCVVECFDAFSFVASAIVVTAGGTLEVALYSPAAEVPPSYAASLSLFPGVPYSYSFGGGFSDPNGNVPASEAGCSFINVSGSGPVNWTSTAAGTGNWRPESQQGTTTLVNGVSPNVSAYLTANSVVLLTIKSALGTTIGQATYAVTTGTPGHFVITSVTTARATQTLDESVYAWEVVG